MARIRTIKPEFWKHEDLSALPEATHMLAAALLNHADDEGYFNANPGLVRAECCPLREPSVSVHDSLNLLLKVGYLRLGTGVDGKRYGHIVKFDEHQRVNRPTASKIKAMEIAWEDSVSDHGGLTDGSSPERKGKEGKGREEKLPTTSGDTSPSAEPTRPAEPQPADPIFGAGLEFLVRKGNPEKSARAFLGLIRKTIGDDVVVAELLITAERDDVSEPLGWLRKAADQRKAKNAQRQQGGGLFAEQNAPATPRRREFGK